MPLPYTAAPLTNTKLGASHAGAAAVGAMPGACLSSPQKALQTKQGAGKGGWPPHAPISRRTATASSLERALLPGHDAPPSLTSRAVGCAADEDRYGGVLSTAAGVKDVVSVNVTASGVAPEESVGPRPTSGTGSSERVVEPAAASTDRNLEAAEHIGAETAAATREVGGTHDIRLSFHPRIRAFRARNRKCYQHGDADDTKAAGWVRIRSAFEHCGIGKLPLT